jgi:hypothetical protein
LCPLLSHRETRPELQSCAAAFGSVGHGAAKIAMAGGVNLLMPQKFDQWM